MFLLKSTKLRRKLLTYSFENQEESYYVRELAAQINEDPGNLSRELKALEEEGLYKSERRGNLKLYSLNSDYPLFDELKKMMAKTEGLEGSLKQLLLSFPGVKKAFIFSTANGKNKGVIEAVVIGTVDEQALSEKIRDLGASFGKTIKYKLYSERGYDNEKVVEFRG